MLARTGSKATRPQVTQLRMQYRYAPAVAVASVGGVVVPYERWQTVKDDRDRARGGGGRRVREKVARGSFSFALGEVTEGVREIKAFMEHTPGRILGRTGNNTLQLRDTEDGLLADILLPDTTDGRDALALIERGDIGMSMGFVESKNTVAAVGKGTEPRTDWRVLKKVDLREISLTPNPAYRGTRVEVRPAGSAAGSVYDPSVFTRPAPRHALWDILETRGRQPAFDWAFLDRAGSG